MKLGEFIEKFSNNNMIRLHYKDVGGYILVANDWNDVSMDWEVNKQVGCFRHYINNEVIKLISILITGKGHHYPEAINIVIEKLDNQPQLEDLRTYNNFTKHETI